MSREIPVCWKPTVALRTVPSLSIKITLTYTMSVSLSLYSAPIALLSKCLHTSDNVPRSIYRHFNFLPVIGGQGAAVTIRSRSAVPQPPSHERSRGNDVTIWTEELRNTDQSHVQMLDTVTPAQLRANLRRCQIGGRAWRITFTRLYFKIEILNIGNALFL